jgi:hypothetical protein
MKVLSIALALLSYVILTTAASANRMNGISSCSGGVCTKVTCPPGTCSKAGTKEAFDARFCSKANCKK